MEAFKLTEGAVTQIKHLNAKENAASERRLRVRVVGGGCSGMSYKLDFETTPPGDQDQVFEQNGVSVVIDKKSLLFLQGTVLDFSDGLQGKGFEFTNPNAKRTCGCGSSFSA